IIDRHDTEENYRLRFSNFLQIELGEDVEQDIRAIVARYSSLVSGEPRQMMTQREAKFIYEGFHRSLFDLIAYGRESHECRLVFDFRTPRNVIYFESMEGEAERIPLKLNPQETSLYYMMVKHSLEGEGLDWRENIPAEEKAEIMREYNEVYYRVGHANRAFEYKDRTQVHHIKNRLRLLGGIANIDMFIPEHLRSGSDSSYRVRCGGRYVAFRF
ncbi:MAG: hypothetical protein IIX40_07855, partial [Alistipes sp.]|nr:hypothetical protein [Alistipes sp.]